MWITFIHVSDVLHSERDWTVYLLCLVHMDYAVLPAITPMPAVDVFCQEMKYVMLLIF